MTESFAPEVEEAAAFYTELEEEDFVDALDQLVNEAAAHQLGWAPTSTGCRPTRLNSSSIPEAHRQPLRHTDAPYAFANAVAATGYATDPSYAATLTGVMKLIERAPAEL